MSVESRISSYYFKYLLRGADPTGLAAYTRLFNVSLPAQPQEVEKRKKMYGITETDPEEVRYRIIEEEIRRSPEAIARQQEKLFYQQKGQIYANNEFDVKKYMELNPDIKQVFQQEYGYKNEDGTYREIDDYAVEALNYYAMRHWVEAGYGEGRKYKIEAPVPEPVMPTNPMDSYTRGGGGGGGFSFKMPSAPALNTSSYDALAAQVNNAISALSRPAASQPTNNDLAPDISAAPSIMQGDPFELLTSSRFSRGLNPYVGTEKKAKTYFESIGLV
jgi:hypothetical protein